MDSNSTMDAFPLREALPICATNARQWGLNRLLDNRAPEVVGRGGGKCHGVGGGGKDLGVDSGWRRGQTRVQQEIV